MLKIKSQICQDGVPLQYDRAETRRNEGGLLTLQIPLEIKSNELPAN